jgi:competence protein ComEA
MIRIVFPLLILVGFFPTLSADEELDERLKAVMLLFDKKHQELTVQIGKLEIEKQKMRLEIENLRERNVSLVAENQSLKKQFGLPVEKQIETAATPKDLGLETGYSSSVYPTDSESEEPDLTNVNVAGLAELQLLPGVGPVIAQRIIDNRPYQEVDDLLKVRGIGKTSIEILRPLVRVE